MPRYFFHLRDGAGPNDDEGQELPNDEVARETARTLAVDLAATAVAEEHHLNLHDRIEVVNEAGAIVTVVEFGDVLAVES